MLLTSLVISPLSEEAAKIPYWRAGGRGKRNVDVILQWGVQRWCLWEREGKWACLYAAVCAGGKEKQDLSQYREVTKERLFPLTPSPGWLQKSAG